MPILGLPRKARLPERVYKYYGPERTEVLATWLVRFSQLAALNDPFEFLINAKEGSIRKGAARVARRMSNPLTLIWVAFSAGLRSGRKNERLSSLPWAARLAIQAVVTPIAIVLVLILSPFISRHMRGMMLAAADEIEEILKKGVRDGLILVFSCSETWKSVPMWAHYAANHTGFVLGIDPSRAFVNSSSKSKTGFVVPRKVKYLRKEPQVTTNLNVFDFVAAKMDHWAYEREWRFIGIPDDAHIRGNFASGQELLLFKLEPDSLGEIIFGANSAFETVSRVLDLLIQTNQAPKIYQVRRSTGYGFERVEIIKATDLNFETVPSGPAPSLRGQKFARMEAAFGELYQDAQRGRLTRMFIRS